MAKFLDLRDFGSSDIVREIADIGIGQSRERCEASLHRFLVEAWPNFESTPFVDGWHIKAICEHLEAVSRGEIKRLLINIPPRHCKTNIVSIAWVAWTWAKASEPDNQMVGPKVRFLCASYNSTKAQQDAVTCRRLIGTRWYQERWGKRVVVTRDRDNQEQYDVVAGGSRISVGIPESLGKGGLIRMIDDPHKTDQVESQDVIESQVRAYNEVWRTRSNDPVGGAEVIIMQRLGEADLSGYLLESDQDTDIVHLCIPALYDPGRHCSTEIGWDDPRTKDGESLWPERHSIDWYLLQKKRIGEFAFAGQYQQEPAPRGGGIIKRQWWLLWPPSGEEASWGGHWPQFFYTIGYLDTAFTQKDVNAYCALTLWGVFRMSGKARVGMIAAWRDRPTLRDLIVTVCKLCEKWHVDNLIIENKAGGSWVKEEIQRQMGDRAFTITLDNEVNRADKEARLHAVSPMFENNMVFAPDKEWAELVIRDTANFPKGRFKDLVDTVSGALGYIRRSNILELDAELEREEEERHQWKGKRTTVAELYGL